MGFTERWNDWQNEQRNRKNRSGPRRLKNISISEISLVDHPANKRGFLLYKSMNDNFGGGNMGDNKLDLDLFEGAFDLIKVMDEDPDGVMDFLRTMDEPELDELTDQLEVLKGLLDICEIVEKAKKPYEYHEEKEKPKDEYYEQYGVPKEKVMEESSTHLCIKEDNGRILWRPKSGLRNARRDAREACKPYEEYEKPRHKASEYQEFMAQCMGEGKSMKECVAEWNEKKTKGKKPPEEEYHEEEKD